MKNSFSIYSASAGSGKTFTLVKEYLELLLTSSRPDAYKHILAITFTNKAVEEMKTRIIKSLRDFSNPTGTDSSQDLLEQLQKSTLLKEAKIRERATRILRSILHNYSAFEISTIDGFNQRILRSFAKDLDLPINFEVALNTDQILLEAVESLISKAGTEKALTRILLNFALEKTDEDKSWDITGDLFEIAKLLTNEKNQQPFQALRKKTPEDFQRFGEHLRIEKKRIRDLLQDIAGIFFGIMKENQLESTDFSRESLPKFFSQLQQKDPDSYDFAKVWIEKLEHSTLYPGRITADKKALLDQLQPELCQLFRSAEKAVYHLQFLKAIGKHHTQLSLLNEINREVEKIKKDQNLLLISEFNPLISAQVRNQPAPFIYERLGERYNNYFIDEFQDTSTMQWENLFPLIEHSLAGEKEAKETASLMLVGDAKQSIYRWRGGKAEQFISLYSGKSPFSVEKKQLNLPYNFRSGGVIVNFNNDFFRFCANYLRHPDYRELFTNSSQLPHKAAEGYVNISFIEAKTKKEERTLYPEKVMQILQELKKKDISLGDVCILTRTRTEGICIAQHLTDQGLPVVSSETLLVANSQKVSFISDLLALSLNPQDQILRMAVFSFLEEKLRLEDPYRIIRKILPLNEGAFFHWLKPFGISYEPEQLKKLSLYEATEYIIRSFSLVRTSDAYVQFFLNYVFEHSRKFSGGIMDFLQHWERDKGKLSIAVPKEENAVQIMTIHKSKGLEFPVVIYPFANLDLKDIRQDYLWLDLPDELQEIPVSYIKASPKMEQWGERAAAAYRELLDQNELDTLNLIYVAFTRASSQLYILSKLDTGTSKNTSRASDLLKGFLAEKGRWRDGILSYEFGATPPANTIRSGISSETQDHFFSNPLDNNAVNFVTRSGSLWDSRQEEAIEKGQIIHDLLAQIKNIDDLPPVMEKALDDGLISSDARPSLEQVIRSVIFHPELTGFFARGNKHYNERDILVSDGRRLRPDRLNLEGELANILDYKTGDYKSSHAEQITRYGEVLEEMGFKTGKKILVYLNNQVSLRYI